MDDGSARERAAELDRRDPIGWLGDRFLIEPEGPIYLDGNSLGRLPRSSLERMDQLVRWEWGRGLVGSWDGWIDLPARVGDQLGQHLLGAAPGQVLISDATTINLYKLAAAALDARPGRSVIVSDRANFPTVRYLLEGLAEQRGLSLQLVDFPEVEGPSPDLVANAVNSDTALLALSHVDYR
ncbi:kynureninase, partial [mine drainage metagenome]